MDLTKHVGDDPAAVPGLPPVGEADYAPTLGERAGLMVWKTARWLVENIAEAVVDTLFNW